MLCIYETHRHEGDTQSATITARLAFFLSSLFRVSERTIAVPACNPDIINLRRGTRLYFCRRGNLSAVASRRFYRRTVILKNAVKAGIIAADTFVPGQMCVLSSSIKIIDNHSYVRRDTACKVTWDLSTNHVPIEDTLSLFIRQTKINCCSPPRSERYFLWTTRPSVAAIFYFTNSSHCDSLGRR